MLVYRCGRGSLTEWYHFTLGLKIVGREIVNHNTHSSSLGHFLAKDNRKLEIWYASDNHQCKIPKNWIYTLQPEVQVIPLSLSALDPRWQWAKWTWQPGWDRKKWSEQEPKVAWIKQPQAIVKHGHHELELWPQISFLVRANKGNEQGNRSMERKCDLLLAPDPRIKEEYGSMGIFIVFSKT